MRCSVLSGWSETNSSLGQCRATTADGGTEGEDSLTGCEPEEVEDSIDSSRERLRNDDTFL